MLAHELSHVAHRDVLVMTVASSAGIAAGMLTQGAQYGALGFFGGRRDNNNGGLPIWLVVLAGEPGRLRRQLRAAAAAVALPRARRRPRRRLPHDAPGRAGHPRCRRSPAASTRSRSATCARSARRAPSASPRPISGVSLRTLTSTHPSLEQRLEQLARIQAELEQAQRLSGPLGDHHGPQPAQARQPRRALPGAERRDHAADRGRADPDRRRLGLLPGGHAVPGSTQTQDEVRRAAPRARRTPRRSRSAPTRSGSPGCRCTVTRTTRGHGGALHRPARGQHHARERRASVPGCSARWSRSPTRPGAAWAWSTCTRRAPSTRSPRPDRSERDNLLELQVRDALRARAPDRAGAVRLARPVGRSRALIRDVCPGAGVTSVTCSCSATRDTAPPYPEPVRVAERRRAAPRRRDHGGRRDAPSPPRSGSWQPIVELAARACGVSKAGVTLLTEDGQQHHLVAVGYDHVPFDDSLARCRDVRRRAGPGRAGRRAGWAVRGQPAGQRWHRGGPVLRRLQAGLPRRADHRLLCTSSTTCRRFRCRPSWRLSRAWPNASSTPSSWPSAPASW